MTDVSSSTSDQSYLDWLKRTLGLSAAQPQGDLSMSPSASPAAQPQVALSPQQSLLTKLFSGYSTAESASPGTTLQSDYNPVNNPQSMWADTETNVPKTPEQLKRELDRAYEVSHQKLGSMGAEPTDAITQAQKLLAKQNSQTPMSSLPYAVNPSVGVSAMDTAPAIQSALTSNLGISSPESALQTALGQSNYSPMSNMPYATLGEITPPSAPAQISATPMFDLRGAGIQAPVSAPVTSTPATMADSGTTQSGAATGGAAGGNFLSNIFGGGGDPQAINPSTGLTNAQTRLMMFNNMANLGFKLAAAGQQMTPSQRAQIIGSMGEGLTTPQAISAMQTQLLQQQKMSRENAQQTNLAKIMQSPEFQTQFKDMSPQYQALAKAAAASGDINGVMGLIEKSQPQFANGMIINRQAGIATDTISNQSFDLNTGKPITTPANTAETGNAKPQDYAQYGIPKDVRVNSQYFDSLSDEYKQRLSKVAAGSDTLSGAARGNAGMMQRMQMDMYRAFPDYNPLEAQNRAAISKSFAKSDNLKSLYGQSTTLGTFAQHEVGVLDKAEKLGNGPLPAFDAVRNEFLNASGDPRVANFNTELHMLQGEVGKMVRAGVLTDQEQSSLNSNISAAKSPEQIRGVLDAYHELVNGRINAVDSSTQRVMGDFYDPKKHSLITPETQKMFDKYNSNDWGRPKTQTSSGAPAVGAVLKGYKFKGGNPADKNNWEPAQ